MSVQRGSAASTPIGAALRGTRRASGKLGNAAIGFGGLLVVVAGLMLAGPVLLQPSVAPTPVPEPLSILTTGSPGASGYTDRLITTSQQQVKSRPADFKAWAQLGFAYQQKARETNDPTYYGKADEALKQALAIKPDYYDAIAGYGQLELSRHNFQSALDWGTKAQRLEPSVAFAYGVIGDAQIELGLYDAAVQSFQKMVNIHPDLSSYSRVSYARELFGDTEGAIQAMQQAVNAGSPAAENTAWTRVQLGSLYFNNNRIAEAEAAYSDALRGYPDYIYGLAALAQVRWAQGKTDEAITLYKRAVDLVPLPQYLTALGDLYASKGDTASAKAQYDTVLYIYKVFEANGVNVGIEKATFLADHDMDVQQAVGLAQAAARLRQDVNTQDGLAWVLYKAGRYNEALPASQQALRLGTENALFYFHRALIYRALGKKAAARADLQKALTINPNFSILHVREAVEALNDLGK